MNKKYLLCVGIFSVFLFNYDLILADEGKHETSGLAITAGYGYEYSGIGIAAEYYISPNTGMLFGIGYFPPVDLGVVSTDGALGIGCGVRFASGTQHRFIGDIHFGFAGTAVRSIATPYGTTKESGTMWGPTLAGGYQFLHSKGFIFQISVGGTYLLLAEDWVRSMMGNIILTATLGIGYKFF